MPYYALLTLCLFLVYKREASEPKFCELFGSIKLLDLIWSKFNHEYNFGLLVSLPHSTYNTHMMIYFELLLIYLSRFRFRYEVRGILVWRIIYIAMYFGKIMC
jgi:hypothetical protein